MARDRAVGRVLTVLTVLFICLGVIFSSGCRGIVGQSPTTPTPTNPQPPPGNNPPPAPQQAPTVAFSATPTNATAGDTVTLTWTSSDATSIAIAPDPGIGTLPLNGTAQVKPTQTTTYTITAQGAGGPPASQSVTVNVAQPVAPTVTITATPLTIIAGQFTNLEWKSTNATSITITPSVLSEDQKIVPLEGSKHVSLTKTTTYIATVTGPGGNATASVTITVTPMQINFTAKPDTIATGQSATLSWSTVGVDKLSIDNNVGDVSTKLPTGSVSVTPGKTTTYTATATGPGGTVTQTAVVSVVAAPPPGTSPIKHIIFILQENRSFDNYFGRLGPYRAAKVPGTSASDVDGFDPNDPTKVLKTSTGKSVKPYHYTTTCTENLTPAWDESHHDVHILPDNSAFMDANPGSHQFLMDRFTETTASVEQKFDPDGTRTMGYYDERDLPFYYELATQFATSDRFFSSLLANTNPNRMYMFTGTSFGHAFPDPAPPDKWKQKTIFRAMNEAGVSWAYYYQDDSVYLSDFADWNDGTISGKVRPISEMFNILASPTAEQDLPQVIFIERAGASGLDEHPENDVRAGAQVVENMIRKLMASAAWKSSAFILSYDEGGGLYDHVAPFQVPTPDDIQPMLKPDDIPGRFNLSGFRIPIIVVSPWVKPHFVSHTKRELTSILKFIEVSFKVPSLTRRDAQADDMTEFFDFTKPSLLTPPALPPQPADPSTCQKSQEAGPTF
jgi:phospholipase C